MIFVGFSDISNYRTKHSPLVYHTHFLIYFIVLSYLLKTDPGTDTQKSERADFPTSPPYRFYLFLLGLCTTKKLENIVIAKKKVILKPRPFASC